MGTNDSGNLEIEVKFLVASLARMRQQLLEVGAQMLSPRAHERNIRYDSDRRDLVRDGKLLRLRQDANAYLTFKAEPAPRLVSDEVRVREELEIQVDDFDTTAAILERLGFQEVQVYEKYRETFVLGSVEVTLDELPFGDFMELEGSEDDIRAAADELGLDWNKRILENYLVLMARLKAHYQLPFDDLTFDNFAGLGISVGDMMTS
ncbi:MAG: class IV adenylate cyclase [Candidatus Promineifilaceae bacterium]